MSDDWIGEVVNYSCTVEMQGLDEVLVDMCALVASGVCLHGNLRRAHLTPLSFECVRPPCSWPQVLAYFVCFRGVGPLGSVGCLVVTTALARVAMAVLA